MKVTLSARPVSFLQPEVRPLVNELDEFQNKHYPHSSLYAETPETLEKRGAFQVAAFRDNDAIGIGAVRFFDGYGEIKRVYVRERFRGTGVADVILSILEKEMWDRGVSRAMLETGVHHKAAERFYKGLGYRHRDVFGEYKPDPLSIYLEKKITFEGTHKKDARYVAAFRSRLNKRVSGYEEFSEQTFRKAFQNPGLVAVQSFRNAEGIGFTASYWSDLECMQEWKNNPDHIEAKRRGKTEFYESFRLTLARIDVRR